MAQVERALLVELGEHQHVLDQPAHAGGLLLGAAHRVVERGLLAEAADAVELGVAADGGEGRAQLVRGVGDESTETLLGPGALVERALDVAEHLVQRHRKLTRLGARRSLGHADREVAAGDLRGGLRHLLHRADAEVDDPPPDEPQCGEDRDRTQDLHEHQ